MRRCLVAMASSLNAGAASFAGLRSGKQVILLSLMTPPRLGCRGGLECYGALAYFGASLRRSGRLRDGCSERRSLSRAALFHLGLTRTSRPASRHLALTSSTASSAMSSRAGPFIPFSCGHGGCSFQ